MENPKERNQLWDEIKFEMQVASEKYEAIPSNKKKGEMNTRLMLKRSVLLLGKHIKKQERQKQLSMAAYLHLKHCFLDCPKFILRPCLLLGAFQE